MKIEDIIIQRDHHHRHHHHHHHNNHHHHHLHHHQGGGGTTVATAAGGTKRTSSSLSSTTLAINAPSSKNHKNETTCTKMSDENNSISATAIAIKNGLNGANITTTTTISSTSTVGGGSSSLSSSSGGNSGITIVAAVTDTRIHVSRANPIHSNSNYHHQHHSTTNNNGTSTASSTTTTTAISSRTSGGITRIKNEPGENNGSGADYSLHKSGGGGGGGGAAGSEIVGRLPTTTAAAAGPGTGSGDSSRSVQGVGGRLQFFKDGKFILELARAKEGEKSGWVSVPRKQFRSPSATSSTVTPTYPKNESSTSLSFSDDNSSIQSSPWQRDHCWKQSTPRRGISKEMCFHFKRTKHILVSSNGLKTARIKRRRPLDNSLCQTPFRLLKNGCSSIADDVQVKSEPDNSSAEDDDEDDATKNTAAAMDDEKSSDGSSTEKEGSVRESSKTPTPESQSDAVDGPVKPDVINKTKAEETSSKTTSSMNGEKRLKSRAKLTTIIQKLIDRLPTGLFHLSKTQIIGGATQQQQHAHLHSSHHQAHSSHHIATTSSRLASELHYHQQHVSPRKRILREFEKVSLEDTPPTNSKRSRAKGNSPAVAASVGTLPLTPIPTSRGIAVPSSSNVTNGNRTDAVSSNNSSNMTANSTPTRLYSSYSIHSLLGGNNNNSSSSSSNNNNNSTNNNRIKVEHSVNQGNDPSYLRAMLASPKSPESCTNSKSSPYSSSASGSAKKRSPPYSPLSEIHHQHHARNRSPNVDATYGNMRSPPEAHSNRSYGNNGGNSSRVTPPHGYLSSPKNNSNSSTADGYKIKSENLTNSSPNHHFYSPYMLSPKYVPPPSSISPNNLLAGDNYHSKLKGARSPSQQNLRAGVYRTQSPHATTNHSGIPRESSPIALQSSPSPGGGGSSSSTPRTVPKKTVSIRRQFASPSSSSPSPGLSEHSKNVNSNNNNNNNNNNNHNSVGRGEERTAMSPDNRRTPTQDSVASKYHQHANAAAAAAAAAMMQRSSPLGGGASSLYCMYPPPNGSPSPHHSSSSPSPSISSSYIPQINPYYHPYVSTLAALRNPLWMHHYPAAAAAAAAAAGAAAAMLPSSGTGPVPQQAVPFFPYNGAGAATTPSHMHHSSFVPMHLAAAGQLGLQPPPPPASLNRSPSTTDDTISPSSIKEEHSSDVPLNLSKH